jgi:hypothetical protein
MSKFNLIGTGVADVKPQKLTFIKLLKRLDTLSWFFIIATVLILGLFGYTAIVLSLPDKATIAESLGDPYSDPLMNFNMIIPHEWEIGNPDQDKEKEVVQKVTGGILFDMKYHSLPEEIVPVALVQHPIDGNTDFSKFLTLAFRGSDRNYSYLQDKVKLMDDFKSLLTSMEHSDILVDEVTDFKSGTLKGTLLRGSGVLKGQKVYYNQYFEPAGANILTVTLGYVDKKLDAVKTMESVLVSLKYQEGGLLFNQRGNPNAPSGSIGVNGTSTGTDASAPTTAPTTSIAPNTSPTPSTSTVPPVKSVPAPPVKPVPAPPRDAWGSGINTWTTQPTSGNPITKDNAVASPQVDSQVEISPNPAVTTSPWTELK